MQKAKTNQANDLVKNGKKAAEEVAYNPWVEKITRVGFAARGIIYGMMGLLTLQVALGTRGKTADQKGVIELLAAQPLGKFILILIAIGLAGYSLWGLVRAVLDPYHKGRDLKGILTRLGYLSSAFSYATLLLPTLFIITSPGRANLSQTATGWRALVARILTYSWGRWAVALVGLIIVGAAFYQFYQAMKPNFENQLRPYELTKEQVEWARRLGRFGTFARAIVFFLVGVFLVQAGFFVNPQKVRGMDEAIMELARQPYGFAWLLVVGLGLISFGIYSLYSAAYFRFKRAAK